MATDNDPASTPRRLSSWKEVAQFFGRSVRTVQDWEKHEGLPIHRHRHRSQSSVYAHVDELDAWWRQHETTIAAAEMPAPETAPRWTAPWAWLIAGGALTTLLVVTVAFLAGSRKSTRFPVKTFENQQRGSYLVGGFTGDMNGDGLDDTVVGAYMAGEVYVVFGSRALPDHASLPLASSIVIRTATADWLIPSGLGDFNGDGIQDVLLTSPLREPESFRRSGSSYIVFGRSRWARTLSVPADADVTLRVDRTPDAAMGGCVAGARRDLNGDGIADVVLGAAEYGEGELKSAGAVFVLFGRTAWPRDLEVAASADVTFRGTRMGEGLSAPCAIGDFDGDRVADVAIYANENRLWSLLGGMGRLYVFTGGAQWPKVVEASGFALRIDGLQPTAATSLAAGDVDGDGIDDIALATSRIVGDESFPGQLRIWRGRAGTPRTVRADAADVTIEGSGAGARLGEKLAIVDVDADGLSDLIVAEPGLGAVELLYGRRHWPTRQKVTAYAPIRLLARAPDDGYWDVSYGDLDGDQILEVIVTSESAATRAGPTTGAASVVKPYVAVRLDVRPDYEPNVLIRPDGLLVARVYGWSAKASDRIDATTVRLGGVAPSRVVAQDFNGDGIEDLQLYFQTTAMTVAKDATQIAVTARTTGGFPVGGSDAIVLVAKDARNATLP